MQIKVEKYENLDKAKMDAERLIDEAAEKIRLEYVTPGSGQAMEYEAASREALEYIGNPEGSFPMLQADVSAGLSPDISTAASAILAMKSQFESVGAIIRTRRLLHKRLIREATTQKEVAQRRIAGLEALNDPPA